jgi:predicted NUDIX family NTP pyrophosphohydrolase
MASSAGILMYRRTDMRVEVLLVHPGGPYWRHKDDGAWSIPKGEMDDGEEAGDAARREFLEETGSALAGPLEPLGDIRQRGGKRVTAFAVKGDLDVDALKSNTFKIEWPPKGGRCGPFPRSIALRGSICPLRT